MYEHNLWITVYNCLRMPAVRGRKMSDIPRYCNTYWPLWVLILHLPRHSALDIIMPACDPIHQGCQQQNVDIRSTFKIAMRGMKKPNLPIEITHKRFTHKIMAPQFVIVAQVQKVAQFVVILLRCWQHCPPPSQCLYILMSQVSKHTKAVLKHHKNIC